jgi:CRISPR-associated protein Csx17
MFEMTKVSIHHLSGCRPTPLAHYLKGLGILRLVGEQADPEARGWWKDDEFHLSTTLDAESLEAFFLSRYSPTPLLSPWNGGSGFYPKDNKVGITAIEASSADRFEAYRSAIRQTKALVEGLGAKPEKGESKNALIASCRREWRGPALKWLDAALALGGNGDPVFPAMLGTGGNDGRLDFTINFMQRLVSLFDMSSVSGDPLKESSPQLRVALWDMPSPTLADGAIGQFFPGAAGGPNGTTGFNGGVRVNPWDYVLMMEGAVLFASGLSRRCQATQLPQGAAPFAVRSSGSGYGSADLSDAGPRGEQWMPLWESPTTLVELSAFLREGRSQINGRPAGRGTDMARAIAKMGVARGVKQFERYGYIERNGLANLAVPLGRFDVRPRPNQRLLDEIVPWTDRLRQSAADKVAPKSFQRCYRACEMAVFNCAKYARGTDFLDLLIAVAEAEDQMLASPKFSGEKCAPVPQLSGQWYATVAEDSAEFRLATALAAQHGPMTSTASSDWRKWASVRQHWVPLDDRQKQFLKGESGLNIGPEQSALGLDLERAAVALINRRLLAMNRGATTDPRSGVRRFPLRLIKDHLGANFVDIAAFLNRQTDDSRILTIARGLMAIKWFETEPIDWRNPQGGPSNRTIDWGRALYGILRLAMPTGEIAHPSGATYEVTCDASIYRKLSAGDMSGAFQLAVRRLANAGLRPKLRVGIATPDVAQRLAASMAFGIDRRSLNRLALSVTAADEDP